jgi:phosphoglycolate phosphatase
MTRPRHGAASDDRVAILFDIDGTLISTGGAGAASWRLAFDELYGIPADVGAFTDTGMTDPAVGRKTFEAVMSRQPERKEFTRLLERRLHHLHRTVEESEGYRVLAGVDELLPKLIDDGYLLGLVTGNVETAAHIKFHRARLNRFFSFGGYGSDATDRGELTRIALNRATLVYGETVIPEQAIAVATRRWMSRGPTPPVLNAWGWPATTSTSSSCATRGPTTWCPHSRRACRP